MLLKYFVLLLFLHGTAQAQLKADFSVDKIGGCSPLTVSFTNKSTGTSSNTTYKWDFGNGNTSGVINPGAIYHGEKVYTVTLTVQEGSQSSVKTQQITVYSKPTVDFTNDIVKGCLPLNVNFTSNSTPGSGAVSSYYWDFGDGSTQQGSGTVQPHVYTAPTVATVSLTVTNSFGCVNTLRKPNVVTVIPNLRAGFSADRTILCRETDPVQFSNSSAGPGTLTYLWDFGDGTNSTERNPSHVFNRRGIFTVRLTVTSSEGCVATSIQTGYINVNNFTSDFTVPAKICSENNIAFSSTSSPTPHNMIWEVNGNPYPFYGTHFEYNFPGAGTYKVKLTNTFGTCIDSAVKQVEVKQTPTTLGFVTTINGRCGAPASVDFRDTTHNAASWQWSMDRGNSTNVHHTVQAPSHTFTENRLYNVLLAVTNTAGCTKNISQVVNIPNPTVNIYYTYSSVIGTSACGPITMRFASYSSEAITQYRWDFGDGNTSTVAEPEHTFSTPGYWQVRLNYTTVNGCTGIAYFNSVNIQQKPTAAFGTGQTVICGNTPVVFGNQSTGNYNSVYWSIDGVGVGSTSFANLVYRFQDAGKHTVKLVVSNGQCSDTLERIDYIDVKPPFTQITHASNTCDGTRGEVTFNHSSREGLSYTWDFGDGNTTTLTNDHASITHTYTQTGMYKIVVTSVNGACTVRDSIFKEVMVKRPVTLTAPAQICIGSNLPYTIGNLQNNPYPDFSGNDYLISKWEYNDGTQYTGYTSEYWIRDIPTFSSYMTQPDATKQSIRVILTSVYFGCNDTSNFVPFNISGPDANLTVDDATVCFNSPVTFRDESTSMGSNIVRREWNFGDGVYQTTTNTTMTRAYPNPGTYYVSLRVTDNFGCTASTGDYARPVTVTGPKAAFYASGSNVPLNTNVTFFNTTLNYGSGITNYEWDFGDGSTGTGYSPSHTYTASGTYTIKLVATYPNTGCTSEATQVIVVKDFNTAFNFNTSFITSQSCPPVLVRFNNTSRNFTRVTWDFGDGITADNVNNPSHIYENPGKYIITLYVYAPNGLSGTFTDSVIIEEPSATLHANDLEGCIGNMVTLFAKADSTKTYVWDFGDGFVTTSTDTFFTYQYNTPGVYSPTLLIKNAGGCSSSATMSDKITIRPNPSISISPKDPIVCLGQATQLEATGATHNFSWSPTTGLNNSTVSSPLVSPTATTSYTVQAEDDIGCRGTASVTIQVVQPVNVFVPNDTPVCAGSSVTIPASGAVIYNWINNTTGLSSTQIASPVATPAITTTYTVTGSDAHHCFTDTAEITVRVMPLPQVNAGVDMEVQAGTPVNLAPTYSNDVIQWTWSPATHLSCSNCPAPVSTPVAQTTYTLTVKNRDGCTAKDSILIKMICDEARVAIPNAFSPNGDGKNDEFIIKGISFVKHLLIYNRWGQKVFERNNFIAADRSTCWDGTLNGYPASPGTYVYFVEMECPSGGVFVRKGSFILIR